MGDTSLEITTPADESSVPDQATSLAIQIADATAGKRAVLVSERHIEHLNTQIGLVRSEREEYKDECKILRLTKEDYISLRERTSSWRFSSAVSAASMAAGAILMAVWKPEDGFFWLGASLTGLPAINQIGRSALNIKP